MNLDRAPFSAFLLAWGRAPDAWWGCVKFSQTVDGKDGRSELSVAAWVPAAAIRKPGWASPTDIPRVQLTVDRGAWPPPSGWPSWYAGPWPHGPLLLPEGLTAVTGSHWKRGRNAG